MDIPVLIRPIPVRPHPPPAPFPFQGWRIAFGFASGQTKFLSAQGSVVNGRILLFPNRVVQSGLPISYSSSFIPLP